MFSAALHGLFSFLLSRGNLAIEIVALRQQLAVLKEKKPRPRLKGWHRAFWVVLSCMWPRWKNALIIVKPETVVRWHREGYRRYWRWNSRCRGRPGVKAEIRRLIRWMASENNWGAPRIHAELLKVGFRVSQATVSRYLPKRPRDPGAREHWKAFLNNHREAIAAMDFFSVPTFTFQMIYVFFIIHHDRRRVLHVAVTRHPTAAWVAQQLREAFAWETTAKYLICDGDTKFRGVVPETIGSFSVAPKVTSFRSPWQNGVAERFVGTVRRELLQHVVPLSENHLLRLLQEFVSYYETDRCHLSLKKDAPITRPIQRRPSQGAKVISLPRVGGLHHRYEWEEKKAA